MTKSHPYLKNSRAAIGGAVKISVKTEEQEQLCRKRSINKLYALLCLKTSHICYLIYASEKSCKADILITPLRTKKQSFKY